VDSRPPLLEIGITLAGVALLAGLVFAVPALHDAAVAAIHGDTEKVRSEIDSLGLAGPLLILVLALVHAIVFYPAEIVDAAAGLVYGFVPALALMMLGWLLDRCSTAGSAASASSGSRGGSSAEARES
jgi:uncharacterized membrane protein YdjX (TVP38/TMEM64 family)